MSQPEPVTILSDDDDEEENDVAAKPANTKYYKTAPESGNDVVCIDLSSPSPYFPAKKKQRLSSDYSAKSNPVSSSSAAPVLIFDDDDTAPVNQSPGSTGNRSIVTETPPSFSQVFPSKIEEASIRKCSFGSLGLNPSPSVVDETPLSKKASDSEFAAAEFSGGNSSFQPYSPPGLNSPPFIVDEAPIYENVSDFEDPLPGCNRGDSNSQALEVAADTTEDLILDSSLPENRLIHLQSDNESERGLEVQEPDERCGLIADVAEEFELSPRFIGSPHPNSLEYNSSLVSGTFGDEIDGKEEMDKFYAKIGQNKSKDISEKGSDCSIRKGRMSKEERKQQKEQEKLEKAAQKINQQQGKIDVEVQMSKADELVKSRKENEKIFQQKEKMERAAQKAEAAALKKLQKEKQKIYRQQQKQEREARIAEAAELKKLEREKKKWEKGKFAKKTIEAHIDSKIVEIGSIGGPLLTRFAEKDLSYRITSNTVERSIVWTISVPEEFTQISSEGIVVPYVLLVYGAEEFCNLVMGGTLMDQVSRVQHLYPNHTICYITNRLMAYINKREQDKYKNPEKFEGWKRPPIEEVLAKLATHFIKVHSRLCFDEAELAEHVVGLTLSLANCQYRKKPTPLSVNANGSLVPKDCADRDLIKKNIWLKALIAIPKVQPRFAKAIWKRYPTMKSLLSVYMDPSKSVHEKEFLLQNLTTEGLLGDDRRLGEICSKRIYRVLMAQCGNIITDEVEHGADFFASDPIY